MSLPIIYIQDSDTEYLPYTLWQAKESSPKSDIIIITAPYASHYRRDFNYFNINLYRNLFAEFSKVFVNYSTNSAAFELMCFSRWFILHEFLHRHQLKRCLHLDSDVLLYSDASRLADELSDYWMTTVGISGHTTFINNVDFFDAWINRVFEVYRSANRDQILLRRMEDFHAHSGSLGGVSDMTFHTENRLANPDRVIDLQYLRQDSTIFDITLDTPMGFKMNAMGVKEILWKDNVPFGITVNDGFKVRFNSLHFQGSLKKLIPLYTRPSPNASWLTYYRRRYFLNKILIRVGCVRRFG